MIELAIFGTLMVLVMGAVISYGLNADYTQQVTMHAQRLAMHSAAQADQDNKPISVSHLVIEDRHLPDPGNPFAIGQVLPFSASASFTRNPRLDLSPEKDKELPRMQMLVNGVDLDCPSAGIGCVTAGFRAEQDVSEDSLERYRLIYGQVCDDADDCDCEGATCGKGACTQTEINPNTGEAECVKHSYNIVVVDSCEGEIVDRHGCIQQARMIVDEKACTLYCRKGKSEDSDIDCDDVCEEPMNIPWYAKGAVQVTGDDPATPLVNERTYNFPHLEALFADSKTMGLRLNTQKRSQVANSIRRVESGSGMTNTTVVHMDTTTDRFVQYKPLGDTQTTMETHPSTNSVQSNETWSTPW